MTMEETLQRKNPRIRRCSLHACTVKIQTLVIVSTGGVYLCGVLCNWSREAE